MRSPGSRARASSVIAVIAGAAALVAVAPLARAAAARPALPARIYAPYFETWTKDRIPAVARASGARYFALAFLQTPRKGSCVLAWNGDPRQTVGSGRFLAQIARLRAMGGDVIPSFGGFSADHAGTEIADSCASVTKIAQAYESVVTTYGVTRLDMDIEDNSLTDRAGIARRDAAIKLLERWAARTGRRVQIVYTIGVEPPGLDPSDYALLKDAAVHHVPVSIVNIMAFDYYNCTRHCHTDMGSAALSALAGTHRQLAVLYPAKTSAQRWAMLGITFMPGIDDFPLRTEVTFPSEVQDVLYFARARRLAAVSIWAIQRDNGRCPGAIGSDSCSGIRQRTWAFSHLLEAFTAR